MEYHGKLYGKVGNKYFDTGSTSKDFDELQQKVDELADQVLKLNLDFVSKNEVAYCHAEKDYRQNECNGYCPHCEYHHTD